MLYLGTVLMFLLVVIGPVSGYECSHGHAMPKLESPMPSYVVSSVLQAAKGSRGLPCYAGVYAGMLKLHAAVPSGA